MDDRSDDAVHQAIATRHQRWCAELRGLLGDIAEHDRRQAWTVFGARSEADYLVRTLDVAWRTAKGWVELAHALERHPELGESLTAGEISADKLTSLIALMAAESGRGQEHPQPDPAPDPSPSAPDPDQAAAGDEDATGDGPTDDSGPSVPELLDLAGRLSAAQLAAQARRARENAQRHADERWRRRRLSVSRQPDDGRLTIGGGVLYDDQAAVVWTAFRHFVTGAKADPDSGLFDPLDVRFADALVAMANAYLSASARTAGHPLVIFHADARLLSGEDGWAETSDYSPVCTQAIHRLACDCSLGLLADDPDGAPLRMGRRIRHANWQQEEAARRRDGGCRLCERRLFTQAHHVRWWHRDRGRTNLDELLTVCDRCHHLLHEGGYRVDGKPDGAIRFIAPDGRVVLTSHPHPQHPPGRQRGAPDHPPDAADDTRVADVQQPTLLAT